MLYRETTAQAQVLAYADVFTALAVLFAAVLALLPLMRRVRAEPVGDGPDARAPTLGAAAD
jgi:hypothetical protein